jgi:RNA polymerase sigma factor (sigma-70 family)
VPTSPLQLTRAMAAGDEGAIEDFYRRYFDWLYVKARRATGRDEAFCLDVVQEAVLRIVRCVRPVESEGRFRAWLRLVVQSTAYDLMKSDARRARREAVVVAAGAHSGPPASEPDAADRLVWLRQQIAGLAPEIARMIDLRFQQSWTLARVGQSLGLSVGTVDGRLRKAIGRLRELAREEFDE